MTTQATNAIAPAKSPARKTLGLTGVTINAMALTAPGAFIWLLYQAQAAATPGGYLGIWPGVLLALLGAVITALSFGELARRYPEAGLRSAYHFAEQVFRTQALPAHRPRARAAKFITGWTAHLYYWVYPGVMVAFMGILADYLLRQFGYRPTVAGQIILACAFAAFIGFLALRGITGTTTSSIILNTVQLVTLLAFSGLAILFRVTNPLGLAPGEWAAPSATAVLLPAGLASLLLQAALAMMLMAGFESSTSLAVAANNPSRDIPRAAVLALILQGVLVYLLEYFAGGLAFNTRLAAPASLPAPIGELAIQIGDALLKGNGFSFMMIIAMTVIVALIAATLTAMNNGVRITFSMAMDDELPDLLGFLHPKYATPYVIVILMGAFSGVVGAAGLLGGLPVLMGIILAANLGAFALYALLCTLTIAAYAGTPAFHVVKHGLLPILGLALNLGMVIAVPVIGFVSGGPFAQAAAIAAGLAGLWLLICTVYFFIKK
ncbi:MAG: APC family permease [Chloroflexota bacterium]